MDSDSPDPGQATIKTLFALSGNVCAFRDPRYGACEERLTDPSWRGTKACICHIAGRKPQSARFNPEMTNAERRSFDNLLLRRPTHHVLIDELESHRFSVELLLEMKNDGLESAEPSERWISQENLAEVVRRLHVTMQVLWRGQEELLNVELDQQDATSDGDASVSIQRERDGTFSVINLDWAKPGM